MDSNEKSRIVPVDVSSLQAGTDVDGSTTGAKRKYVPPRCHCLALAETEAKSVTTHHEATRLGSTAYVS